MKINSGQMFRWAVLEGRLRSDITASLRGLFITPKPTQRTMLTDSKQIGEFLRAIDGLTGQMHHSRRPKLTPLAFARPGELHHAVWSKFDLDGASPPNA